MTDATANDARSIAAVMRRALLQDEHTPPDQLISFRTLCEIAAPVLEQIAAKEASD